MFNDDYHARLIAFKIQQMEKEIAQLKQQVEDTETVRDSYACLLAYIAQEHFGGIIEVNGDTVTEQTTNSIYRIVPEGNMIIIESKNETIH